MHYLAFPPDADHTTEALTPLFHAGGVPLALCSKTSEDPNNSSDTAEISAETGDPNRAPTHCDDSIESCPLNDNDHGEEEINHNWQGHYAKCERSLNVVIEAEHELPESVTGLGSQTKPGRVDTYLTD